MFELLLGGVDVALFLGFPIIAVGVLATAYVFLAQTTFLMTLGVVVVLAVFFLVMRFSANWREFVIVASGGMVVLALVDLILTAVLYWLPGFLLPQWLANIYYGCIVAAIGLGIISVMSDVTRTLLREVKFLWVIWATFVLVATLHVLVPFTFMIWFLAVVTVTLGQSALWLNPSQIYWHHIVTGGLWVLGARSELRLDKAKAVYDPDRKTIYALLHGTTVYEFFVLPWLIYRMNEGKAQPMHWVFKLELKAMFGWFIRVMEYFHGVTLLNREDKDGSKKALSLVLDAIGAIFFDYTTAGPKAWQKAMPQIAYYVRNDLLPREYMLRWEGLYCTGFVGGLDAMYQKNPDAQLILGFCDYQMPLGNIHMFFKVLWMVFFPGKRVTWALPMSFHELGFRADGTGNKDQIGANLVRMVVENVVPLVKAAGSPTAWELGYRLPKELRDEFKDMFDADGRPRPEVLRAVLAGEWRSDHVDV